MLSSRWPTVARGSRFSHKANDAVELANGPLAVQHKAWQRAGLEYARQILGVAGQRQLVQFSLHASGCAVGVGQREGAQSRG